MSDSDDTVELVESEEEDEEEMSAPCQFCQEHPGEGKRICSVCQMLLHI